MSEEYATTRQDFLTATASYLGLDVDSVSPNSEVGADDAGHMVAVLHVWLKPSDIIGIGKRMQEIAAQNNDIVQVHVEPEPQQSTEELRKEWDEMHRDQRGKYGSFSRYVTWRMMNDKPISAKGKEYIAEGSETESDIATDGVGGRNVTHVDAPEEPEPTNMDSVWITATETTDAQRQFASDIDPDRGYLIQWSMLTDEQKQKAGKP